MASTNWTHSLIYRQGSKIRSMYFHIIPMIIRDFKFWMNRSSLLRKPDLESIGDVIFKWATKFINSMIIYIDYLSVHIRKVCIESQRWESDATKYLMNHPPFKKIKDWCKIMLIVLLLERVSVNHFKNICYEKYNLSYWSLITYTIWLISKHIEK